MKLPIYIYGQPVLRKVAEDITPEYPELKKLIADMFETCTASDGVGLAAPQIGKAIRVVVIDLTPLAEDLPEYKDFRKAYINAHILASVRPWKRVASLFLAFTSRSLAIPVST